MHAHITAYQAVKFYNYSIKKKDNEEPFKPFITDEAIAEESAEIEDFLNAKNNHNSEDSFGDETGNDSNEENPPKLPPPLPKKTNTLPPTKPPIPRKPESLRFPKVPFTPMHDLRDIDKEKEVNDNNFDCMNKSKSTIVKNDVKSLEHDDNNSNNNTFIENKEFENEPILRDKQPPRVNMTDEQVYKELRHICNLSDPLDKYKKLKEVGKGASGVVFIASVLGSEKQVAIKTIDMKNQSSKELILNEIRVLKDFNHKNLVNFLDAYYLEELDHLWVVLEYMNG